MSKKQLYFKVFNEFRNGSVKIFTFWPALDLKINNVCGVKVRVFVLSWLIWSVSFGWAENEKFRSALNLKD